MIQVTRPFLPSLEEYSEHLRGIWERNWLTNNGPLVVELENRLKDFLGVKHLMFMSNGTITLQALLKTIPKKGKILTTPFSYIATSSAILWEGFEPVFVDIDPDTLNADAQQAEKWIDQDTVGVLITHCFGVPCDVVAWQKLADQYHLPVIYDAAHAFAVKIDGQSILKFGYASSLSFHATKLFHTIEGGAVVCEDEGLDREMMLRRNFGHDGFEVFSAVGVNGKNSEFHAAMGLVNLNHIDEILKSRKTQYLYYRDQLSNSELRFQHIPQQVEYNYSYFPVLFPTEEKLLTAVKKFNAADIYPRRYFYPSLNQMPFTKSFAGPTPIAEEVSRTVLCLPLFYGLAPSDQDRVMEIITSA